MKSIYRFIELYGVSVIVCMSSPIQSNQSVLKSYIYLVS